MIGLEHVIKYSRPPKGKPQLLLDSITYAFMEGQHTGILGLKGAVRKTFMDLLCGRTQPDKGRVYRMARVSWPIGNFGGFVPKQTGRENLRFICRLYGADVEQVISFVDEFTGLGADLDVNHVKYPRRTKAAFAFATCLAMGFDYYVIDENFAGKDRVFRQKAWQLLERISSRATLIIIADTEALVQKYCGNIAVFKRGKLLSFTMPQDAILHYKEMQHAN